MKVLFVNKLYPPDVGGGAEVTLASIVSGVHARGVDVRVVTMWEGITRREESVNGVSVVRIPLYNLYWHNDSRRRPQPLPMLWHAIDAHNIAMGRALRKEIEAFGPDLVSFHNLPGFSAAAWDAASDTGTPGLQVLHDYYHLCARSQLFRAGQNCDTRCAPCRVLRLGRGRLSRKLAAVVGISQSVLDTHVHQGLFQEVRLRAVIHNARELAASAPRGYPRRAQTFGFLGTLGPWKGVQQLLEAFEHVSREPGMSELRRRIAGTGEDKYTSQLRQRFESPAVSFLGQVASKMFFQSLDVLVVPPLWNEPLGMVAVEALIAGVPVIGAARGGLPEIVRDGRNGLLFDPDRAGDLERCLRALAQQDGSLAALGAQAIASASSFGNVNRMIDAYLNIYTQVARQRES